ncbi:MAG: hypothetical protein VR64_25210 [Desulfatitalea sp. BRH_c12]|nr:MAG: hypothetical protein VR64_25210 [Desulfatitalea sp. BRH_c12]
MKRNFRVEHGVEIWKGYKFIDLHNLYILSEIFYSMASSLLTIVFCRNKYPAPQGIVLPSRTVFVFSNLFYLEISNGLLSGNIKQLEEIGYKNPGDSNMDWLITEDKSKGGDHIVLRFQEDEFVRIGCDVVNFNE